jgi:predicted PurR-regulated permease PerM
LIARLQTVLASTGHWLLNRGVALGEGVLQLTLSVFVAFFLFRDGASLVQRLSSGMQRLAGSRAEEVLAIAGNTTKGVVYGVFGTALVQGVCAAIGFWIAGVPSAFLLGVGTCFLSLVPGGPPLIWLPASVWLYTQTGMGWAIFMFVWGLLVVSSVDNFVKPYLISRSGSLPFVLVLLGILGGILAFGFVGVFLGPILLAVGFAMLRDWTMLRRTGVEPKT